MNENDLEALLRDHYHGIDPTIAPGDLDLRIGEALDRGINRQALFGRLPVLAAALAAVVVVAAVLALRPSGPPAPVGTSPSPSSAGASASPSVSPSQSGSPVARALPSGSVPPISTQTWTTLDLQPVEGGPAPGSWVVGWSGGYLALWQSGDPHYNSMGNLVGAGPLYAWVSRNGRTWTQLPADTFGAGGSHLWRSPGGRRCHRHHRIARWPCDCLAFQGRDRVGVEPRAVVKLTGGLYPWPPSEVEDNEVAGGRGGVVALSYNCVDIAPSVPAACDNNNVIEFSADGKVWQDVTLPGDGAEVQGVAAFGTGFVAVGIAAPTQTRTRWRGGRRMGCTGWQRRP